MVERDKTLIYNGGDADDLDDIVSQGAGGQWHWKPSPTAVAGWELFILDGNDDHWALPRYSVCGEVQDCADSGDLVQRLREAFYYQVLASGHHHPDDDDYLCQIIWPFTTKFMLVVTRIILFQRRRNIKQWPNVIFRFAESRTRFCAPSVAKNSAASASSM